MVILVASSLVSVKRQVYDDEDYEENPFVPCPPEAAKLYKDCVEALDKCSGCLGSAQTQCEKQFPGVRCECCTNQLNGRCNGVTSMCFGNKDCVGVNYECLNYACVYVP